ncbi:MAG TPA: MogA/MoaB family molybdenum cofactor biosynthesis protein [Acidimicrobiales bacterium]|jgi:molybdenum cofactor synthesis domain-containing protein
MPPGARIITVSDSTYRGEREDRSGPALVAVLEGHGFDVGECRVVPDGAEPVATAIRDLAAGFVGAILTTGGTGFAPTDQTPEGTQAVLERLAPGLAEAMRAVSPLGRLSRGTAGTLGQCIVLNLPGSTTGALECLEAVIDVLPHALDLLAGGSPH